MNITPSSADCDVLAEVMIEMRDRGEGEASIDGKQGKFRRPILNGVNTISNPVAPLR